MRVSVAMAVHDSARHLPQLLQSVARQTSLPHELVVYDDASRDRTPELVGKFAETAPFRVRVERDEVQQGPAVAFLRAAALCQGDAIAFCDADDVWHERKLELCARELARTEARLVLHTARVVDENLRDLGVTWPSIGATRTVPPLRFTGLAIDAPGMAMVFRREILEVGRGLRRPSSRYEPDREMLHDEWTLFLAGVLGPIRILASPLVLYRQHGGNVFGWTPRERTRTLRPAVADYRSAAAHVHDCVRFLDEAASRHPELRARLVAGARHYRRTAEAWERRLLLYESPSRRARLRLVWSLLAARSYRERRAGGFGTSALAKDLAGGVLFQTRA